MAIVDMGPGSNNRTLAHKLAVETNIHQGEFLEAMIRSPDTNTTWRPSDRRDHDQRIQMLKAVIDEYHNDINESGAKDGIDYSVSEYIDLAQTGQEFLWLSRRIDRCGEAAQQTFRRRWNDCMLYHISKIEHFQELLTAYLHTERVSRARQYALYRMVEIRRQNPQ